MTTVAEATQLRATVYEVIAGQRFREWSGPLLGLFLANLDRLEIKEQLERAIAGDVIEISGHGRRLEVVVSAEGSG